MGRKKAVFHWSGGKDSALALHKILQESEFEVVSLLTLMNENTSASTLHGIPLEILKHQAESIGIRFYPIKISEDLKNYSPTMQDVVDHFKKQGVNHFIFGDTAATDIKTHREKLFQPMGMEVVAPLGEKTSAEVISDFLKSGIKAKLIVIQENKLLPDFIGKDLEETVIDSFPPGIDICGENGEYHTLAYAGGPFRKPISFGIARTEEVSHHIALNSGKTKTFGYLKAILTI